MEYHWPHRIRSFLYHGWKQVHLKTDRAEMVEQWITYSANWSALFISSFQSSLCSIRILSSAFLSSKIFPSEVKNLKMSNHSYSKVELSTSHLEASSSTPAGHLICGQPYPSMSSAKSKWFTSTFDCNFQHHYLVAEWLFVPIKTASTSVGKGFNVLSLPAFPLTRTTYFCIAVGGFVILKKRLK